MLNAMKKKFLHTNIWDTDASTALIACDTRPKNCMYRTCGICKDAAVPVKESPRKLCYVNLFQWVASKVMKKQNEEEITVEVTSKELQVVREDEFLKDVQKTLNTVCKHIFNTLQTRCSACRLLRELSVQMRIRNSSCTLWFVSSARYTPHWSLLLGWRGADNVLHNIPHEPCSLSHLGTPQTCAPWHHEESSREYILFFFMMDL